MNIPTVPQIRVELIREPRPGSFQCPASPLKYYLLVGCHCLPVLSNGLKVNCETEDVWNRLAIEAACWRSPDKKPVCTGWIPPEEPAGQPIWETPVRDTAQMRGGGQKGSWKCTKYISNCQVLLRSCFSFVFQQKVSVMPASRISDCKSHCFHRRVFCRSCRQNLRQAD